MVLYHIPGVISDRESNHLMIMYICLIIQDYLHLCMFHLFWIQQNTSIYDIFHNATSYGSCYYIQQLCFKGLIPGLGAKTPEFYCSFDTDFNKLHLCASIQPSANTHFFLEW